MPRRVVVAGAGGIAGDWLRPLSRRPDVELVAVADPDTARASSLLAEQALDVPVDDDLGSALARGADLLVNLTPPGLHRAVSEQGLAAGCDVLTEKPLTDALPDAVSLVEAARAAGRTLAVMQNRRYLAPVVRMNELVAEGAIGEVVHVCIDMFLWHVHGRDWLRRAESPLLRDMAIHPFDAVRAVTGLEPVEVQATEWTNPATWLEGAPAAACTWRLENGAVFSYRGSWAAEGLETSYDGVWRVGGTTGTVVWDGERTLTVETVARDGPLGAPTRHRREEVLPPPPDIGHAACLHEMLDALAHRRQPATVATDNLVSLAMVYASLRSARERRTITLAETLTEAARAAQRS